jgi:hypothetical protein
MSSLDRFSETSQLTLGCAVDGRHVERAEAGRSPTSRTSSISLACSCSFHMREIDGVLDNLPTSAGVWHRDLRGAACPMCIGKQHACCWFQGNPSTVTKVHLPHALFTNALHTSIVAVQYTKGVVCVAHSAELITANRDTVALLTARAARPHFGAGAVVICDVPRLKKGVENSREVWTHRAPRRPVTQQCVYATCESMSVREA